MASRRQTTLIIVLLAVLTAALYWQVRNYDYVHFDDPVYIKNNVHVKTGLSAENMRWSLTSGYAANWHPLTWMSYMAEVSLFGESPKVFHITNVLIHIVNTCLVFVLLRRMTGDLWPSTFVAALFAIHPLHVESVAWISERKDLLSTFFGLFTIWAYVCYVKTSESKWFRISLLAFVGSLMSKQMFVTLPFLLWVLDYWPLRRREGAADKTEMGETKEEATPAIPSREQLVKEKLPFLALAVVASIIVFSVQDRGGAVGSLDEIPVKYRLLNAVLSYGIYLKQMAWPLELSVFYPHPGAAISLTQVALVGAAMVAVTLIAYWQRKQHSYLWVGWLWFVGTLVPVIGIVQIGAQQLADRYTYFPALGVFVAVAWGFQAAARQSPFLKRMVLVTSLLMLSVWSLQTYRQVGYWQNSFKLFQHAIKVTKNNTVAFTNLGLAYQEKNNDKQAEIYYRRAIEANANHPTAYFNLGVVYQDREEYKKAEEAFREALERDPTNAQALAGLGAVLHRQGLRDDARNTLEKAVKANPDNVGALNNLGILLIELKQFDKAIEHLTRARQLDPYNETVLNSLGQALAQTGQVTKAMALFEKCLELDPDSLSARFNLGSAYQLAGELDVAANVFRDVLKRQEDYEPAISSLVVVLNQQAFQLVDKKDFDKAEQLLQELMSRQPKVALHAASLGMVRMMAQQWQPAKAAFEKAIELDSKNAEFYARLGIICRKLDDNEMAVKHFQKALELNPEHAAAKKQLEQLKNSEKE